MTKAINLESKLWYRSIKVIYITAYLIAVAFVILLAYSNKPYSSIDSKSSLISCNDGKGKPIKAGDIGVYLNEDGTMSDQDSKAVSALCGPEFIPNNQAGKFSPTGEGAWEINYTVKPKYETIHSWGDVFITGMVGLGIIVVILEVIRRTFLYIVIGKKFI